LNIDPSARLDDKTTPSLNGIQEHKSNLIADDEYSSTLRPVFLLLIVLVIIFILVVIASILVIIKIWVYRRKKSTSRKSWIIQQKMLSSKAQMSHLLTMERRKGAVTPSLIEPYESTLICHELSSNSFNSDYDVP